MRLLFTTGGAVVATLVLALALGCQEQSSLVFCRVCLPEAPERCAESETLRRELSFEPDARKDARETLCYAVDKSMIGPCHDRPDSDLRFTCERREVPVEGGCSRFVRAYFSPR